MQGDSDETTDREGDEKNWLWSQAKVVLVARLCAASVRVVFRKDNSRL